MHVFLYFAFFPAYFLPVLKVELILKQINEKTVNYKAAVKRCALPFVTPVSEAVCKGHHRWRCDTFTTRPPKSRAQIPGRLPLKAPVKSSAPVLYIFYNSVAGSLFVCPFRANLREVEQSSPLRARPARSATVSDRRF